MHSELSSGAEPTATISLQGLANHVSFESLHGFNPAAGAGGRSRGRDQLRRKVREIDEALIQQNEGVLDDVLELADVAGIVLHGQNTERHRAQSGNALALDGVEDIDEMLGQTYVLNRHSGDPRRPLATRRRRDC